jgi:hypothetical protein
VGVDSTLLATWLRINGVKGGHIRTDALVPASRRLIRNLTSMGYKLGPVPKTGDFSDILKVY